MTQSGWRGAGMVRSSSIHIFAGGRVSNRKPSPDIFNLAKGTLGVDGADCLVIEDDEVGGPSTITSGIELGAAAAPTAEQRLAGTQQAGNHLQPAPAPHTTPVSPSTRGS